MADENNVLTVLKMPLLVLVLGILLVGFCIMNYLVPNIQEFSSLHSSYEQQVSTLSAKEATLERLKDSNAAKVKAEAAIKANNANLSKEFFKPLESGMDTENIIASEFNEILSLMTSNAIKTRSVKYTYDPDDDEFVKGAAGKYSVCKLDMEMIASYSNFKNFMKDLYKHDHYLDIAKIEIIPYQKNKTILLINLQLKLYAEKA